MVMAKKLGKFDTKTFLSTIDGGSKIEAFRKKQAIFVQGRLVRFCLLSLRQPAKGSI